jgi:cell division protein FtsB
MSAILKAKRRTQPAMSSLALWAVLGLAVTFFLVRYGQELLQAHDLNDRAAAQRGENATLKDENSRLQAQFEYYKSDKYIEQRAREDLNLRRPEEEVLIPIAPQAQALGATGNPSTANLGGGPPAAAQPATQAPGSARANWQRWLDLFSPAP